MLRVPLRRDDPEGTAIGVEIYRFKAAQGVPADTPPLFRLNGGPGWPGLGGSLSQPGFYERQIQPMTEMADVVFVGQRGIGSSPPNTECEGPAGMAPDASQEEQGEAIREASRRCREHWESQGYHLRGFNVIEAAADVADAARLLGYEKITIWGVSFGSHWGMSVMRFHPETVARALLGGMEGPDHTYDMPSWVLNALKNMAASAEQDPGLASHIPEGGLIQAFKDVIARVESEEIMVEVNDSTTDSRKRIRVAPHHIRDLALGYTRRVSSRRGMPTWPADILRLHRGEFQAVADSAFASSGGGFPTASFFMLDCGSGISPTRGEILRNDPDAEVVGPLGAFYDMACPEWGADLGEGFRQNFNTDIPTAIVHGNWDTSTPLENALELKPYFTNSHFTLVEGGSHGALQEAINADSGFRQAIQEFIMTGESSNLPDQVTLPPIDWVVPE